MKKYSQKADFLTIYIREAHADDSNWPNSAPGSIHLNNHKSLENRNEAAQILKDMFPDCPIYLDGFENEAEKLYSAFPDKMVIIYDDHIQYIGGQGPFGFKITELVDHLEKLLDELS